MSPQISFLESNDETKFFEVSSSDGSKKYDVMYDIVNKWICTCPDYHFRKHACKHIKACAKSVGIEDITVYEEVRYNGNN